MDQTSSDALRSLLEQYTKVTKELNTAIDQATVLNNQLATAKAEVTKNKHKKELIEQQIMCEKKFIDAAR